MLFVHISDIHFKHTDVGEPDDPNKALRGDIVRDVGIMRSQIGKAANGILISGDVAYHGREDEYAFAYKWLEEELCPAAGCKIEDVFVAPGNHDVDRAAEAGPAQIAARSSLRRTPRAQLDEELRKWLRDPTSANVIFGPIENYNRFAAKFLCALRPYKTKNAEDGSTGEEEPPAAPFAKREVYLSDNSVLRLWGFSTVIVSDKDDALDLMLIDPAAAQIQAEDGVAQLVMCHHPFSWLRNGRAFEDRVNAVAKIQLFGHEHTQRLDEGKRYLRIRAGALQPARDEPEWKPGYNWIDVDVVKDANTRKLTVKTWVRMHEVSRFIAVPDPDNNEIWENSYKLENWTPPTPVSMPSSASVVPIPSVSAQASVPQMTSKETTTVRSVTTKFFKLPEHVQRRIISELSLYRDGDRELKDYEQVVAAVKRSDAENRLEQLSAAIDAASGGT